MQNPAKQVYLMRGLPACGKSHTARRLAGERGIVLETDQYFYTQVGDDPAKYDYSEAMLPAAREWNLARFRDAVAREQKQDSLHLRRFLVSGGAEDPPKRWEALNHTIEVNRLLGHENRVAMTNRPDHAPNDDSNEVIYSFFEHCLLPSKH